MEQEQYSFEIELGAGILSGGGDTELRKQQVEEEENGPCPESRTPCACVRLK